jgi:hypothetical protein
MSNPNSVRSCGDRSSARRTTTGPDRRTGDRRGRPARVLCLVAFLAAALRLSVELSRSDSRESLMHASRASLMITPLFAITFNRARTIATFARSLRSRVVNSRHPSIRLRIA